VFDNDFPAVKQEQPIYDPSISISPSQNASTQSKMDRLFKVEGVRGLAKVLCFSEKHSLTMAEMTTDQIQVIIKSWITETNELKARKTLKYAQIFENKGAAMGCSNPHPHGQIWATDIVPQEPMKELFSLENYKKENGCCLLCDLVDTEIQVKERIVCENNSFICFVPFWAIWPFETMILSKKHKSSVNELDEIEQRDLADLMRKTTCKYDNLFKTFFPYSMGVHGAPLDDESQTMHLHIHYYPPLLRSATVKKFLVGFEMLGEAQRDLTAEQAATRLRELSEIHYTHQ
jgi:UDPglucose--hexose-1-phosphate uridylyltransferase